MSLNARVNGGQEENPTRVSFDLEEHGYVSVQDEQGNTLLISEDEDGNLQVYYADHLTLTIEGEAKDKPEVTVDSDEFPLNLTVMDREDAVDKLRLQNLNI